MAAITSTPTTGAGLSGGRRSLISPWTDFWLLGGASIAFCLLFGMAEPLRDLIPAFEGTLLQIAASGTLLSLFVNGPHFMASYRLAYSRDRDFIRRNRFELVQIPIGLAVVAVAGVVWALTTGGLESASGTIVIGGLATAMFITVGWHYVKQIYGCVRVTATFDGYEMGPSQMTIIRYGLFPLWIRGLVIVGDATQEFANLSYGWFASPPWLWFIINVASAVGALAIAWTFVEVYRQTGQRPSARMLVPIVAIYAWWVPAARFGFPLPLVPFFHSLQYIPFVTKVERSKATDAAGDDGRVARRLAGVAALLFVIAGLAFFVVPLGIDLAIGSQPRAGMFVVFLTATLFINVHHYYVDHVIWRLRDDPYTRDLLLR